MPDRPTAEYKPLPPAEAIAFFRKKYGYRITFDWHEMRREDHARAFTVTKAMSTDILKGIRDEVDRALAEGGTLLEFQNNLEPFLREKGWWGKKIIDGREVQLGSPARLQTIFRTNIGVAYMAGRYRQMMDPDVLKERPYFEYDAVNDSRTRPEHLAWDGLILPANDPWWDTHFPPSGWNCRCSVNSVSREEMEDEGLTVSRPPDDGTYDWVDRQGNIREEGIPNGIDPGWDYNPGKAYLEWDGYYEGDFTTTPTQKTFLDFARHPVKEVADEMRHSSPAQLPKGASIAEVAAAMGISEGKPRRIVNTKIGEEVVISRDRIPHMIEKTEEARERYASYVLPTLVDPFEVYLTEYKNPQGYRVLRTRYIGLFSGAKKEDILAVVNITGDGGVLWNIMQARRGTMDQHRVGTLLYGK